MVKHLPWIQIVPLELWQKRTFSPTFCNDNRSGMVLELSGVMSYQPCDQHSGPAVLPEGCWEHSCWQGPLFLQSSLSSCSLEQPCLLETGLGLAGPESRSEELGWDVRPWLLHGQWASGGWRICLEGLTSPVSHDWDLMGYILWIHKRSIT